MPVEQDLVGYSLYAEFFKLALLSHSNWQTDALRCDVATQDLLSRYISVWLFLDTAARLYGE